MASLYDSLLQGNFSTLVPLAANLNLTLTAALTHATRTVEQLLGLQSPQPSEHPTATFEKITTALTDYLSGRTALENTSIFLALSTFVFLVMSWASRLGNLGRFSPFTRSPPQGSTKVSDADFSYITADDLRRHQAESMSPQSDAEDLGPPRDTDVLILRNKKKEYAVHFPAYSIAKNELSIGQVRDQAAKKTATGTPRSIKLLYKGKNLKDDSRTARQEGLRDGAELMCTIAEPQSPSDSEDDFDEFGDALGESGTADGETRRKRNRGKKSKRRNKREERDAASGTSTPQSGKPNLGVPNSQQPSRTQSPRPAASPATPFDKLNTLHQKLQTYIPDCEKFLAAPPTDAAKKEFEHKRLTETILAQVLLKLDGVETEGDEEARSQRKALVKETQAVLNRLDAAVRSS